MCASSLLLVAAVAAVFAGCTKPDADIELTSSLSSTDSQGYASSSSYDSASAAPAGSESWASSTYAVAEYSEPMYGDYDTGGSRIHVVQKRDTLYGLARSYYGDASQWKKIFEANSDQVGDPDKIKVGMKLLIP